MVQAIQKGRGVGYDFGEEDVCVAIDRKNGNFFRNHLVDAVLATIVVPKTGRSLINLLDAGIHVADVGCGCGTSTIAMAKRFPKSTFYAFESSPRSLFLIEQNVQQAKLTNVVVCDVAKRTVGDGPDVTNPKSRFGFVYAHDVLHDMTQPQELIADVQDRLSPEGCWVIVDIDCSESATDNLKRKNAATLYGFSCLLCLSMATSEAGGKGLGTCGFSPTLAKKWTEKAGFSYFSKFDVAMLPYNACYLVA